MSNLKRLEMKKMVKIFAVMRVSGSKMVEVYRSESKKDCLNFKKENRRLGKLGIMYIDNKLVSL